jgi:hypothetical protein
LYPDHLILLNLITLIFEEEYILWSSWLCSFCHLPVTSFLLNPHFLSSVPCFQTYHQSVFFP